MFKVGDIVRITQGVGIVRWIGNRKAPKDGDPNNPLEPVPDLWEMAVTVITAVHIRCIHLAKWRNTIKMVTSGTMDTSIQSLRGTPQMHRPKRFSFPTSSTHVSWTFISGNDRGTIVSLSLLFASFLLLFARLLFLPARSCLS